MRSVIPAKTDEILLNPGCGAMLLQRGANKIPFDKVPKDAWFLKEKLIDKIAFTIPWSVLEPEEGKILWDHPDWEGCINTWIDAGFKVALEVRGMDTWGTLYNDGVPQWVFDAGAKYVDEPLELYKGNWTLNFLDFDSESRPVRYPVYWDAVYLEKVGNLVKAMGERYNGHPEIEFVCNGHLGRWGEMHLSANSPLKPWYDAGLSRKNYLKAFFRLAEIYSKAFPDTLICQEICDVVFSEKAGAPNPIRDVDVPEIYAHLAEKGMIIKHNGIGKAWNGNRSKYWNQSVIEIFEQYYRQTPVAIENLVLPQALDDGIEMGHVSYWHPGGEREGLHILEHERKIPLAEKKIWSYLSFFPEEYSKLTIEDEKNVWRKMARHCGYRLEIEKIFLNSDGSVVTIQWHNSGNAPCYLKLTLEIEVEVGGKRLCGYTCPVLADGVEKYRMPENIPAGAVLKLRLRGNNQQIKLGNSGLADNGWYKWEI